MSNIGTIQITVPAGFAKRKFKKTRIFISAKLIHLGAMLLRGPHE